jgi:hypothetical protein
MLPMMRAKGAIRHHGDLPVWVRQYKRFITHQPVVEERIEVNADGNVCVMQEVPVVSDLEDECVNWAALATIDTTH